MRISGSQLFTTAASTGLLGFDLYGKIQLPAVYQDVAPNDRNIRRAFAQESSYRLISISEMSVKDVAAGASQQPHQASTWGASRQPAHATLHSSYGNAVEIHSEILTGQYLSITGSFERGQIRAPGNAANPSAVDPPARSSRVCRGVAPGSFQHPVGRRGS